jgi:DNA polymerase phi
MDWKSLLAPTFKHTPLLHSSNLVTLAPILKVGHSCIYRDRWLTEQGSDVEDDEEDSGIASTGAWKPQPHFVWNIILDKYFTSSSSSESAKRAPFQDFFRVIVDGKSITVAMYRPADPI